MVAVSQMILTPLMRIPSIFWGVGASKSDHNLAPCGNSEMRHIDTFPLLEENEWKYHTYQESPYISNKGGLLSAIYFNEVEKWNLVLHHEVQGPPSRKPSWRRNLRGQRGWWRSQGEIPGFGMGWIVPILWFVNEKRLANEANELRKRKNQHIKSNYSLLWPLNGVMSLLCTCTGKHPDGELDAWKKTQLWLPANDLLSPTTLPICLM